MRLAIIGLGHIAQHQKAALEFFPELQVVASCDLLPEKEGIFNGPYFLSARQMLAEADFDVAIISTPAQEQFPLAKLCLEKGRHVLLEKPATGDPEILRALKGIASEHGRILDIALHAMHGAEIAWAMAHQDLLSKADGIRCEFSDPYCATEDALNHGRALGGSWIDSAINAFTILDGLIDLESLALNQITQQFLPNGIEIHTKAQYSTLWKERRITLEVITDWTQPVNDKRTTFYGQDIPSITLHHSGQRVFSGPDQDARILFDASQTGERLTNHYRGVFQKLTETLTNREMNSEIAERVLFLTYYGQEAFRRSRASTSAAPNQSFF